MKITRECKLHFQTAELLMQGVKESMQVYEKSFILPPEHSEESIRRRIIQIRQELLRVSQELN